jgi:amino acid permease
MNELKSSENQKLQALIFRAKVCRWVGLLATVSALIYGRFYIGTAEFEFWIAAFLVVTAVIAIFAGNIINIGILKKR